MKRMHFLVAAMCAAAPCGAQHAPSPAPRTQNVGAVDAAALRTAARTYRDSHEVAILREFAGLLAIPNVASDHADIRRNADMLVSMLKSRGVADARLLELGDASPAVYGSITVSRGNAHSYTLRALRRAASHHVAMGNAAVVADASQRIARDGWSRDTLPDRSGIAREPRCAHLRAVGRRRQGEHRRDAWTRSMRSTQAADRRP